MVRVPTDRTPTHPGEMLLEEFLRPMGLSEHTLAEAIHVSDQKINGIVSGYQSMTPSVALRLARFFNVSPDFWMNLQLRWDLYHTQQAEEKELAAIKPYIA